MRAQVSLTVAESKKLIARGVAEMDIVKKAIKDHIIAIQPSTTTFFLIEYLTKQTPKYFVSGAIIPEGATRTSRGYGERDLSGKERVAHGIANHWLIRKGRLDCLHPAIEAGKTIDEILRELGPADVYIRSANAVDPQRNIGILVADPMGGTAGRCAPVLPARGVTMIFPVGLEKLIPISVFDAAKECGTLVWDYSMGLRCGLIPCGTGVVVTELEAISLLSGATATPIASGGIAGAEGAVTMAIKGTNMQIEKIVKMIEKEIKGTKSPEIVGGFVKIKTYRSS